MSRCTSSGGAPASSAGYVSYRRGPRIYLKIETYVQGNECLPSGEKSKRGGSGRPFGKNAFGALNSSKKGCAQASN